MAELKIKIPEKKAAQGFNAAEQKAKFLNGVKGPIFELSIVKKEMISSSSAVKRDAPITCSCARI